MITIALNQSTVAAGGILTGQIGWSADGDRRARKIIVAAQWETDGAGNKAKGAVRGMSFVPEKNAREAKFPIRFLIPHEGPITFRGELIRMRWTLRVRVDQFGLDELAEQEFRAEPRARGERPSRPQSPGVSPGDS